MRTDWNCASGDTVFVTPTDSLGDVPDTHRNLVTPAIEAAFRNPCKHFQEVSARCPFPSLARYLNELTADGRWELRLHTNGFESPGIAAFAFGSTRVMQAEIAPAEQLADAECPEEIGQFYSLLDWVHWTVYGGAGGLDRGGVHDSVRGWPIKNSPVAASQLKSWGSTPCGDAYVYTLDGRGGLLSHENGHLHLLGTIAEAIDWIFEKLCRQELPDFDYKWCKRK
jgi:hypothetical protein